MVAVGRKGVFVREFLVHAEVARSKVLGKTVAVVLRLQGRVRQDRAGRRVAGVVLSALGQVDVLVAPVNEQICLKNDTANKSKDFARKIKCEFVTTNGAACSLP